MVWGGRRSPGGADGWPAASGPAGLHAGDARTTHVHTHPPTHPLPGAGQCMWRCWLKGPAWNVPEALLNVGLLRAREGGGDPGRRGGGLIPAGKQAPPPACAREGPRLPCCAFI